MRKITSELSNFAGIESKHTKSHSMFVYRVNIQSYSIQNSIHKVNLQFGVERKSIRKWIQQLSEMTQVSVRSKTKTQPKEKGRLQNIEMNQLNEF